MQKVLISIPDQLAVRMRATIPARQRSQMITGLIESEVKKREQVLYECAVAVENDDALRDKMDEWGVTLLDGLTAVCDQIRTVDKSRLRNSAGQLSVKDLYTLDEGLRQVLAL